ncbi:alpha/beta fold hydrolase [Gordonia polyisoprenivorans]|uniref:alpha/beta fold hydrolase n=1 Tax=Gordonia polyisoprenivorans TaxID=84595 RepID=UPI001B8B3142|nr:alpha/beta fold hydrolase [Gordonia polyisoprenivorans]QUD83724.1 alpha/beta fold hydrolase [Gordonia polyisoprenivorans]
MLHTDRRGDAVNTTAPSVRRVEIPAGTIEYLDEGSGAPVVLLHGLFMDEALWDPVMAHLPNGFRYIRPVLPLGAHRVAMNRDADLTMPGMVALLADFLDALDLREVTLVHTDWGGGLFLTAAGRDERVGAMVILPCEAFENFPPGLPGKMATIAARLPGGLTLAARQLRNSRLRRLPMVFGQMTRRPISDELARRWTEPVLTTPGIATDLASYAATHFDRRELIADTEALARFTGHALVLWSPDNRVMPPAHGRRLAELIPGARYAEIADAAVLLTLDAPVTVGHSFLTGN